MMREVKYLRDTISAENVRIVNLGVRTPDRCIMPGSCEPGYLMHDMRHTRVGVKNFLAVKHKILIMLGGY